MIDESNLISTNEKTNTDFSNKKNDLKIMKIQHNLIMMGFDITMVNKIISNFKINTEGEAIEYLIKSENGMWNHPFIPKEEDINEQNINIFDQPKNVVSNVLTKINSVRRTTTFNAKNADINIKEDEENNIINTNNNIKENKIRNDDICEICGEAKEFHNIKEFIDQNNINEDEKIDESNILSDIKEKDNILNEDINNNINIIKEDEKIEEEDVSDPNICQICMDDFDNPQEMEKCKHKFCRECFHSYLVDRITNNQIEEIPCPKKNCKNNNLSENFFSQYLTEQEYFKYRQFKAQNEIAKDNKKIFCPLCDSYADIQEGEAFMYDSNNTDYIKSTLKCQNGHEFCSCGRPIHEGDCFRDEKEFKDLLITENIKKCPKCGFLIKKNRGCNHMTCGNPVCKYEFCWLCMQEAVPNHFDFGPCAGKQFFDPDSFEYKLKQNHPCLYCLYSFFTSLLSIIVVLIAGIAVPGIGLGFISFSIIFLEEDTEDFQTSVKVIMFLGYFCFGFAYQTIIYIAWGIVFAGLALLIALALLGLVCQLLKVILKCICCISDDDDENANNNVRENNNELNNNINANDV